MDTNQLPDGIRLDPETDMGFERSPRARISIRRVIVLAAIMSVVGLLAIRSGAMQAILEIFSGHQIPVGGAPVAATHSKLSEHEIEYINGRPPQEQMERLL